MKSTTVAVDLAKSVFQLAVADASWRGIEQRRLTRSQFEKWFINRDVSLVIMEACGSAHHWTRHFNSLGIEVKLLPAAYIRAYVKRNKTDAMRLVPVRCWKQPVMLVAHSLRSPWPIFTYLEID